MTSRHTWSKTIPYRDYREPYLPEFFPYASRILSLKGHEKLLDIACGTGKVAFGFNPYVASLTGIDMELPMLESAQQIATAKGIKISLVHSLIKDMPQDIGPFNVVTIGKAHWYMDASKSIPKIETLLAGDGKILVCLATAVAPWRPTFLQIMADWSPDFPWWRLNITPEDFFTGSNFGLTKKFAVENRHVISMDYLVKRAFGYPCTSAASLGDRADDFAAHLKRLLLPYSENGRLMETLQTIGYVFNRK